jgi:hypothetical protein
MDMQSSLAELVYVDPLGIPGELLTPTQTQWIQPTSSRSPASTWPAWDQFRQHATHPQQHSCARTSTIARMSSSARSQLAGLRCPLTAAPTRSSGGERRRYSSLWAASPSQCQPTRLSRLSTQLPAQLQPRFQGRHRRLRHHHQLLSIHAPATTSPTPHASKTEQTSAGGDKVVVSGIVTLHLHQSVSHD